MLAAAHRVADQRQRCHQTDQPMAQAGERAQFLAARIV